MTPVLILLAESIAVLGASPGTHRIRGRLLHQLRENGFYRILPINPSYQDMTACCHAAIGDAGRLDLALVAIPTAGVASGAGRMRTRRGEEC